MSVANDEIKPKDLTIRVLLDMVSLTEGVGHVSASLNLVPLLRQKYPNAIIELIPLHGSLSLDKPTMEYYISNSHILEQIDDDDINKKKIGEQPATEYLTEEIKGEGPKIEIAKKMMQKILADDVSQKTRIINIKDYIDMSKEAQMDNVVAVSGAFDEGTNSASNVEAWNNQYGSKHPVIIKQPIGWTKGVNVKDNAPSLPPMPNITKSAEPTFSDLTKRTVILYKTFEEKNNMKNETLNALHTINNDAKKIIKHMIFMSSALFRKI